DAHDREPARREGNRRDGDDRIHSRRLQRGPGRGGAARSEEDRHAAHRRACLAGDPRREEELNMYAAEFDYHRPKSLAEAQSLLQSNRDPKLLAAGHSLLPAMKLRMSSPKMLVDLSGLAELSGIKVEGSALHIGATTTHATIAASPEVAARCPILAEAASQIG